MRKNIILVVVMAFMLTGCAGLTKQNLKENIRKALREDPSLIMEVLQEDKVGLLNLVEEGAAERREQAMFDQIREDMEHPLEPVIDETRPMVGDKDAPLTVVSYTDFQCGYCARGSLTLKELMKLHPGTIRYTAKHAPMSEQGEQAAIIFEAVGLQSADLAWEYYAEAFAKQNEIREAEDPDAAYLDLAKGLKGIDAKRLDKDIKSEALKARVMADAAEYAKGGFRGVPVYLYNGVPIEGAMPLETLEKVIAMVLGQDSSESTPTFSE